MNSISVQQVILFKKIVKINLVDDKKMEIVVNFFCYEDYRINCILFEKEVDKNKIKKMVDIFITVKVNIGKVNNDIMVIVIKMEEVI